MAPGREFAGHLLIALLPNRNSLIANLGRALMDDKKKGIIEKTIEAVEEFAHEVTDAAKHMLDSEPLKPGDEVVMIPSPDYGMFGVPSPPHFAVIHHPTKSPAKKKAAKTAVKKPAKKSTKKTAKKSKAKSVAKKLTEKVAKKKKAKTPSRAVKKKKKKAKRGSKMPRQTL